MDDNVVFVDIALMEFPRYAASQSDLRHGKTLLAVNRKLKTLTCVVSICHSRIQSKLGRIPAVFGYVCEHTRYA